MESFQEQLDDESSREYIVTINDDAEFGEPILTITLSLSRELRESWPEDTSDTFALVDSDKKRYWKFVEVNEEKDPDALWVVYHKEGKKINPGTFLESDYKEGEKGRKIAKVAGGIATAVAATGGALAAYLIIRERRSRNK